MYNYLVSQQNVTVSIFHILMGIEFKVSCLVCTTVVNMSSCTQWTLHSAYNLVLTTDTVGYRHYEVPSNIPPQLNSK